MKEVFQIILSVFADNGIQGWQAVLGTAVAAMYAQLVAWHIIADNRAQKQITKMEGIVAAQDIKIDQAQEKSTAAKLEAENAKVEAKFAKMAATQPCHLPQCPKRNITYVIKEDHTDEIAGSE